MNILYVFIATGLFWEVALSDTSTNSSKLENLLYERCKHNSLDASSYDEVKTLMEDFTAYLRVAFSHIPEGKEQFCTDDKKTLVSSARAVATRTKDCFRSEEKYLPSFVYESFAEFLNFLCEHDGKNINNIFSTFGRECMHKLKAENAGTELGHCFNKVVAPLNGKVKKDKLCEDLSIAKKCFGTLIEKHCPDFRSFELLNKKLFKAIQKPCESGASALGFSSLVLIMVTFISTKIAI